MFVQRKWSLSVALVAAALGLAGCTSNSATQGSQTPGSAGQQTGTPTTPALAADQPVVVAILAPTSSSNAAAVGEALVNAAKMAVAEQPGARLDLRVYDTAGNATQARLAAEKAIADGAMIILGPLFSANAQAVAGPAATAGIKVLSFSTDAAAAGDPVYLTGFLPEVAAARITTFARARGYGAMGIFYPGNLYGAAASRGATQAVGPNIVVQTEYERTERGIPTGAQAFAAQARDAGVQAVLLADSGQALNFIGSLMQNYDLSPQRVKYLGLGEWNSRITLGERSLRGGWFAAPDPAAVRAFVEKYQGTYGAVPPIQAVLAYDAANMVATLAAEARASGQPPFTTETLTRGRGFQGAVGPILLGRDGIARRGLAILEVGEGVFTVVDPAPSSLGLGS